MDDDEIAVFVLIALAGLLLLGWGARNVRRPWDDEAPGEDVEDDDTDEDDSYS